MRNLDRDLKRLGLVCFVGNDVDYGSAVIRIALEYGLQVIMIVGETAERVHNLIGSQFLPGVRIINRRKPWEDPRFIEALREHASPLGISCGYDYIIPRVILKEFKILNCHPSALPFNRGCHHSFYGIMEQTPLGATLHWIDEGIDTGPIIAQAIFSDNGFQSASEIQNRSLGLCLQLWRENLKNPLLSSDPGKPQILGTYHGKQEILEASTIQEGSSISSQELFNLCRATNNKGNGFRIKRGSRTFLVRIQEIVEIL